MRQRVEDLGRLAVLIRDLIDHKLFDEESLPHRPKDNWEWFNSLPENRKEDVLHSWVYGIENLKEKLYEILEIARGPRRFK